MVRVTDFGRPKRTYDKDDPPRISLPPQQTAYKSQRESQRNESGGTGRGVKRKLEGKDRECFICHQQGHLSRNCPQRKDERIKDDSKRACYRCGKTDHTLKDCKVPFNKGRNSTQRQKNNKNTTSSCRICQSSEHITSSCPKNENGNYDEVGVVDAQNQVTCVICGATDHLKRQCPQKDEMERVVVIARKVGDEKNNQVGGDEDGYHEKLREEERSRKIQAAMKKQSTNEGDSIIVKKKKPKVVNFR